MSEDVHVIAANIERIRLQLGLSKAAVARRSEIADADFSRITRGRLLPYAPQLARIAKALGVEVDTLQNTEQPANG